MRTKQMSQEGVAFRESDRVADPELLLEVLEVRETLEGKVSPQQLDEISQRNDLALKRCFDELSTAFRYCHSFRSFFAGKRS